MTTTRREFLRRSALAGVGLGVIGCDADGATTARSSASNRDGPADTEDVLPSAAPKRILILGGTGFIGPHEVNYARARGHTLTLFNRGETNPELFSDVEQLRGDRNDDLEALRGREWDVVIDNHATLPGWVERSAEVLKDQVEQYVFISTISVYKSPILPGTDESTGEVFSPDDLEAALASGGSTYGPNKAQAEREAEQAFPGRTTIIRPGLIVGPGDPTDRFTYWPLRVDRGGEILAPGDGSAPVQVIDVRDLTRFIVGTAEAGTYGIYNATGPRTPYSMAGFLHGIRAVTGGEVEFVWVPADFLLEAGVSPWSEMTVWFPPGPTEGLLAVSVERAVEAGLTFRPLADTTRDTLQWFRSLPAERQAEPMAGVPAELEREVLEAWHRRDT